MTKPNFRQKKKKNILVRTTCLICPFNLETKEVRSEEFVWRIENKVKCKSNNIVYMLVCTKDRCKQKENRQMRYLGETERTLKDRICEHVGYINTKNSKNQQVNISTLLDTQRQI